MKLYSNFLSPENARNEGIPNILFNPKIHQAYSLNPNTLQPPTFNRMNLIDFDLRRELIFE